MDENKSNIKNLSFYKDGDSKLWIGVDLNDKTALDTALNIIKNILIGSDVRAVPALDQPLQAPVTKPEIDKYKEIIPEFFDGTIKDDVPDESNANEADKVEKTDKSEKAERDNVFKGGKMKGLTANEAINKYGSLAFFAILVMIKQNSLSGELLNDSKLAVKEYSKNIDSLKRTKGKKFNELAMPLKILHPICHEYIDAQIAKKSYKDFNSFIKAQKAGDIHPIFWGTMDEVKKIIQSI